MGDNDFFDLAVKAAKKAGEIQLSSFEKNPAIAFKSTHFNLVTKTDLESEEAIVSAIRSAYPDHNILAEENDYGSFHSPFTWIIDPLDGTNNFAHHFPVFSVSIALAKNNEILLGVVLDPIRGELFSAKKGEGAMLNGKSINVTGSRLLKESLLGTGFYYNRGKEMKQTLKNIERFFKSGIVGIRRMGSAALDLCYVACGRLDGFWEYCLSPWDFAAGALIVEEAGGKVTDKYGEKIGIKPSYIVSSNGNIHDAMLKVIK
jgi:myo-inositol-1(or 4)-monophosphatase